MSEKWQFKCVPERTVRDAVWRTGFAARSLPRDTDETAWLRTEYTLSNLKTQLRKIRANLAQGHEGPHLYPLAQMGDRVLEAYLEALVEAVAQGGRHGSFDTWRLLFILKKDSSM